MEIFNVNKKEIDQVKRKTKLKSTNSLKINKRKRKQKDIIIKLIKKFTGFPQRQERIFTKFKRFYRHT